MLKVKCFEDADNGYPCIIIHGKASDYERAALYLATQTESSLNDPKCFEYYPAEVIKPNRYLNAEQCQELQEMFSKRDCLHLDKKDCRALAEIFSRFVTYNGTRCHDYYEDNKAMSTPLVSIRISIGEYDDEMFTD